MEQNKKQEVHIVDATGQSLGRLAVRVAVLLRGKDRADFRHHIDGQERVLVKNAKRIKFSGKKLSQKIYYAHSGYMGGLRKEHLAALFLKRPTEVLRKAVWGMLPKNRLRSKTIKRLTIEE